MEDSAPLPVVDHRVEGGGGHGQPSGDEAVLAQTRQAHAYLRAQVPRRRRLLQARPSRSPRRRNGTYGSASMWDSDARSRGGLEVDPRCTSSDLSRVRAEAVDGRNNRDSQYSAFWQYVSREVQGGIWPADTSCALWRHINVGGMSLQNGWQT